MKTCESCQWIGGKLTVAEGELCRARGVWKCRLQPLVQGVDGLGCGQHKPEQPPNKAETGGEEGVKTCGNCGLIEPMYCPISNDARSPRDKGCVGWAPATPV